MRDAPAVHASDELAQHLLGHVQIGDDAVSQRPAGSDRRRRASEHALGLIADRQHAPAFRVLRHHRRLGHRDAAAPHVHERVRCAEIDRELATTAKTP